MILFIIDKLTNLARNFLLNESPWNLSVFICVLP
jgi:hypothetical protein